MTDPAGVASLRGKTALVTGGARRIGRGICQELADAGCDVVIHHRSSHDAAAGLEEDLRGRGVQAWSVHGDLVQDGVAERLFDDARAAAGHVDLVVHNASTFQPKTWKDATWHDVEQMMRLHAWAPMVVDRAAAANGADAAVHLLDARIVADDPQHGPYLLSKQALWHLTQEAARRFAPMRVNGVAPGPILPPSSGDDPEQDIEAARKATVLRKVGSPEVVAHAVRFLLENTYVTGEVVFVDGGRHLPT